MRATASEWDLIVSCIEAAQSNNAPEIARTIEGMSGEERLTCLSFSLLMLSGLISERVDEFPPSEHLYRELTRVVADYTDGWINIPPEIIEAEMVVACERNEIVAKEVPRNLALVATSCSISAFVSHYNDPGRELNTLRDYFNERLS